MNPRTFFTELKRRNVYKVAVAYAIVSWLLIQAASILFPTFEAPAWVMKIFVTALILGVRARERGVNLCSARFSDKFGQKNCVMMRKSNKSLAQPLST